MLQREDGFTLIELMVTMVFIGIVVITLTLSLTNALHIGRMSTKGNQALNLAGMIIEDLLTYDYSSTDLTSGTHQYDLSGLNSDFVANYEITDPGISEADKWDHEGNPLLKTITVTVQWDERNRNRQVQLTTYRARTVVSSGSD